MPSNCRISEILFITHIIMLIMSSTITSKKEFINSINDSQKKAYERILSEFQIVLNVSLEDTQKKLDKALKRNLGGQPQPAAAAKTPTNELPVDEPISDNDEPIDE